MGRFVKVGHWSKSNYRALVWNWSLATEVQIGCERQSKTTTSELRPNVVSPVPACYLVDYYLSALIIALVFSTDEWGNSTLSAKNNLQLLYKQKGTIQHLSLPHRLPSSPSIGELPCWITNIRDIGEICVFTDELFLVLVLLCGRITKAISCRCLCCGYWSIDNHMLHRTQGVCGWSAC